MSADRPMNLLQRSTDLVQALLDHGPLTPAEIADRIDTPRPTVYRLSEALQLSGLVESHGGSRITLSRRWLRLGEAARAAMVEWRLARPLLEGLSEATGHTVFLSVLRGDQAVCIDWVHGPSIGVLMMLKPGRSLPLYAGAEGRAMLAYGRDDPESYLDSAPFAAYTARTLVTADALRRDIQVSRDQGFTVSSQDVTEGIGALGVPLYTSRTREFAGVVSVAGLTDEMVGSRTGLVTALRQTARALSATLA